MILIYYNFVLRRSNLYGFGTFLYFSFSLRKRLFRVHLLVLETRKHLNAHKNNCVMGSGLVGFWGMKHQTDQFKGNTYVPFPTELIKILIAFGQVGDFGALKVGFNFQQ